MEVFIKCLCEERPEYLIIEGTATPDELKEAWILLLSEYQEIKGDTIESMEQVRLTRDIWYTRNHLQLVDHCTNFLAHTYSESIADSLRKLGYSFKPVEKEPAKYANLLNLIINKTKQRYVILQQMIKQLDEVLKKVIIEKPKRESFETTLISIEEMQGVTYDFERLMVTKYVMLEKKLVRQIELLNNKKQWQPKG